MEIETIRTALEQTYQDNRALIAGLSDTDMDRSTPNPKWKVRQLAAHIAGDDAGALYVAKILAKGKNAKAPDFVINLANWWGLRKYKKATASDLLPVMDEKHRQLMAWLDTVPAEALDKGGEVSQVGRVTLGEFLVKNGDHSREHGADIRTALTGQSSTAPRPSGQNA
jgi:hypothetical protein